MASSTLPSYSTFTATTTTATKPTLHAKQHSDYFTSAMSGSDTGLAGSTLQVQQDSKAMTRECLLFPTYAYRNPQDPSGWVIRTRGWALSHNRSGAKQKFVTRITKGVVGQNSGDQATFEERVKYFLAKNKRNKRFIIQAVGTSPLPSDSWTSPPSLASSSSSCVSFSTSPSSVYSEDHHHQQQRRRDSDGSTDSGFQSSGTDKDNDNDYFYHPYHHPAAFGDLYSMERPANPLSSILSGRRMQSTASISSNSSNDSTPYAGDDEDDTDDNVDDEELPSSDHYLTDNTIESDTANSTNVSSLFTFPSFTSSMTSNASSSAAINNKVDGQAVFRSESSGFFSGPMHLSHQQVLQWAKEKDCCDARLLRLQSTPYHHHKDPQHPTTPPASAPSFPISTGMVNLIEPTGISIISDIDDTIKETQILHGARKVLVNTFFNASKDISGMAETYMKWYTQGASFHYVSNSPFQLLPFLQDFLNNSQFPPGSMHLRLDGSLMSRLIEVPGRAKRDSILSIMADFPLRQFVLVGDSGEIDLEIYTKIALEHPGRILKIFIHDVTTPYALHKQAKKRQSNDAAFGRSNSMSLSTLFESESDTSSPVDTRTNSLLELASSITSCPQDQSFDDAVEIGGSMDDVDPFAVAVFHWMMLCYLHLDVVSSTDGSPA
ncbi:hypothetical protein [Absidia glauca]|uniref:Phosphatidate phosphatase APP1 catalytic domain-containing protein n=1 Tax=Absidia glauca TaxID=4829 RepID=A0A163JYN9_ABSGL|nr:hypothetical protein [Absidia glauca]